MTYLVGGTPRAGKTVLKDLFLKKYGVPGFCTDYLRDSLRREVPEFGIKENMSDLDKSEVLWPFFKGIVNQRIKYYKDSVLIEGTNFLPKYLREFKEENSVRIVFLGYADMDPKAKFKQIRENQSIEGEWTGDLDDRELEKMVDEFLEISRYFRKECEICGLRYFETSRNFGAVIEQAADYLMTEEH